LHDLLYGAAVDGTQNALTVLFRDICRQFDLNLENLVVAVFRVNNVVLRQADVFRGNVAGRAVQLYEIRRTQRRRSQKVVEWAWSRTIAFVANRLIGNDREIIELGFKSKVVEKVDLDFHAGLPE